MLEELTLIYEVTIIPAVLFAGMTKASERFLWERFHVPQHLQGLPIECRFLLFNEQGDLVEFCSEVAHPGTVTTILNSVPEIMVTKLIGKS